MNVLTAEGLTLGPQTAAHAEPMFEVLGDPALYEFENDPPPALEWLADRCRKLESRRSPDGSELWLNWIVRLADSRLIGFVQATVYAAGHSDLASLLDRPESTILGHMRTRLTIDDDLLRRAQVLTGIQEKTVLVRRGLERLVALESARRLAALGGSEKKLKLTPRRRTGAS